MTTDEEINFGSMVTSPPTFNLEHEPDKETPSVNCIDLFPNPPKLIEEVEKESKSPAKRRNNGIRKSIDKKTRVSNEKTRLQKKNLENKEKPSNEIGDKRETEKETPRRGSRRQPSIEIIDDVQINPAISTSPDDSKSVEVNKNKSKVNTETRVEDKGSSKSTASNLPSPSPSLSVSSYSSSTESISSLSSIKKKKKKRYCQTCDIHFRRSYELFTHLKSLHVSLPIVEVSKLPEENTPCKVTEESECKPQKIEESKPEANPPNLMTGGKEEVGELGGLKLKLKLSGPQNFQVVPPANKPIETKPKKAPRSRTTKAARSNPPPAQPVRPLDAMVALAEMHSKQQNNVIDTSKYFECPTLDGLDQFAEEVNNEVAEDLLKKLLEGQQQVPQESSNEWSANTNEFISIDRLAHICTVCHSNFPDALRLFDHKRTTGHDFQPTMQPPPSAALGPGHHMNIPDQFNRSRMPFHPPNIPGPYCPPLHAPMNGMQMKSNFSPYPPRHPFANPSPGTSPGTSPGPAFCPSAPGVRRPPPLYRVPSPQCGQPVNMTPFIDMNPEMYIPSSNGNPMMNGVPPFATSAQQQQQQQQQQHQQHQQHQQQQQQQMANVRQPVFLKARLQRAARPQQPKIPNGTTNGTPSPPIVMSQQTATRPRFLGPPYNEPPPKKHKNEQDDCELVATQPRTDGIPIIQSVAGGVTESQILNPDGDPKDPIQLNDQITLSLKQKEANKNPKDVANILATRGITVTHKPKIPGVNDGSPKDNSHEAVHKLQLNNSVSIISKKKPLEPSSEEMSKILRPGESAFISCPIIDCEEKFLTQEGLNRHTQRGHRLGVPKNVKALRCRHCSALFSTQDGLSDHQRRNHRQLKTSADELGIPIIDLRNEQTKQKLAQLGIVNYIPLSKQQSNSFFGFPIVSVQGAANPNVCNILGLGASSLLSLGPIKQIPTRRGEL